VGGRDAICADRQRQGRAWARAEVANTQTRDESGEVERAATKHRELKVPTEVLWRELGYTEQQIKEMSKLAEQEAKEEIERQREQFAMKAGVVGKKANGDSEILTQWVLWKSGRKKKRRPVAQWNNAQTESDVHRQN
jgi:hypothetical protein